MNYTNTNPFTVPEGYFDKLNAEILAKLPERKEAQSEWTIAGGAAAEQVASTPSSTKKGALPSIRRWWYSAAAVALLLVGVTFWGKQYSGATAQTTDIELSEYLGFDNDAIYDYFLDYNE